MAIAVGDSKLARNNTALAAMNFAAGDCLVVWQSWDGSTGSSWSDNNGNTTPAADYTFASGGVGVKVWVRGNQAANAAVVVTPSGAGSGFVTVAQKITGADASPLYSGTPNGNSTASGVAHTTATAGSMAATPPVLLLSGLCPLAFGVTTWTASGFAVVQEEPDNGTYYGLTTFSKSVSSPGTTESITSVPSVSSDVAQVIIALKEAAGGPAGDTTGPRMGVRGPKFARAAFRPNRGTNDAAVLAPITADLSLTDAADTLSATASVVVGAALSTSDAVDTLSGAATATVTAGLSLSDAADTLSASSTEPVTASLSLSDAVDTLSAAGTMPVTASFVQTDAADTLSGAAGAVVTASMALSDAVDTLSGTATLGTAIDCTLSLSDAADTLTGAAVVTVGATFAQTDAADTLAGASTSTVVATLSLSDALDTLSAASTEPVTAALSLSDAIDTLSASLSTAGPIAATLNLTDDADTLFGQCAVESERTGHGGRNAGRMDFRQYDDVDLTPRRAVLNLTDAADALTARCVVAQVPPPIYAALNLGDAADTLTGAAVVVPWEALVLVRENTLMREGATARWSQRGRQ